MLDLSGFDLKRAQLVPHAVFNSPGEVVATSFLSFAQKQTILRRWEFDAMRMPGGAPAAVTAVQRALRALAGERIPERADEAPPIADAGADLPASHGGGAEPSR